MHIIVIGGFLLGFGLAGLGTGNPSEEICSLLIVGGLILITLSIGIKTVTDD